MEIISWSDAKAKGLTSYFTGVPCKNGHIAKRYKTGACQQCINDSQNRRRRGTDTKAYFAWPKVEPFLKRIYWQAINRARSANIPFTLTNQEFLSIWDRAGGVCEFSGITFAVDQAKRKDRIRSFFPSLDRRDSDLGYTAENCRMVCIAVNMALRDFGDQVLDEICIARAAKLAA